MGLTDLQACNRAGTDETTFYEGMKLEEFSQYIKKGEELLQRSSRGSQILLGYGIAI
jgi:hypothetical protein